MEKETLKRLMDANRRGNIAKRPKRKIKIKFNEGAISLALCITFILLAIYEIVRIITTITN